MNNQTKRNVLGLILAASLGAVPAAQAAPKTVTTIAGIPFVSYGKGYRTKIDFAELDDKFPIPAEALQKLTPTDLIAMDQEQLDQLYGRLSSGPIPDGKYDGSVYIPKGSPVQMFSGYLDPTKLPNEFKGVYSKTIGMTLENDSVKGLAQALWYGKHFYKSQGILRNRMNPKGVQALAAFGINPRAVAQSDQEVERFPAKLYCGTSLGDVRRESIIIDYMASKTIDGYQQVPDLLASGDGLAVRDEIRMIRPGFYLGKAYAQRAFLLTFALYSAEVAEKPLPIVAQIQDECWSGYQERKSSLAKASE
jgi:hypothetical protein